MILDSGLLFGSPYNYCEYCESEQFAVRRNVTMHRNMGYVLSTKKLFTILSNQINSNHLFSGNTNTAHRKKETETDKQTNTHSETQKL